MVEVCEMFVHVLMIFQGWLAGLWTVFHLHANDRMIWNWLIYLFLQIDYAYTLQIQAKHFQLLECVYSALMDIG